MIDSILFFVLSIPIIIISWRSIFNPRCHGFYRFYAWELILFLLICNYSYWFKDIFSVKQISSWIILFYASYIVIAGVIGLRKARRPQIHRDDDTLFEFEKTTELVDAGIYRYIRHPLYGSLLYFTWGIFLKNTSTGLLIVSFITSIFLYLTAKFDEKECIQYFGDRYKEYMKYTKMFIPFLF